MRQRNYLWVVIVAIASICCWQAAQSQPQRDEDAEMYRLFVDAVEHVDRSYVKPVKRRELIEAAIHGMLEHLDPYSNFIAREEKPQFEKTTKGNFGGVGIQVDIRAGDVRVVSPMVGTPAYDAGILAGDRILKVDGQALEKLHVDEVIPKISGAAGTKVTLTLQHAPYKEPPYDVTLTRQVINVETIRGFQHDASDGWDYLVDPAKKIAYIRMSAFSGTSEDDLEKVLKSLQKSEKLNGLVLDLRYNPGGLLSSAIKVCNLFVKEGKIVSTKGRGNTSERVYNADGSSALPNFPMAVLVNRFSASASEIVSACLQDHERAVVVGERSWGKGSVQNVIDLDDGKSLLKLTVASYNRPNGHNIHRFKDMKDTDEWGVKPNAGFEVPYSYEQHSQYSQWRGEKDFVKGKRKAEPAPKTDAGKSKTDSKAKDFDDKQLAKALEYVRSKLAK